MIARAHAAGVLTLVIKSSDGAHYWSQFSPGLVHELRADGLHVRVTRQSPIARTTNLSIRRVGRSRVRARRILASRPTT